MRTRTCLQLITVGTSTAARTVAVRTASTAVATLATVTPTGLGRTAVCSAVWRHMAPATTMAYVGESCTNNDKSKRGDHVSVANGVLFAVNSYVHVPRCTHAHLRHAPIDDWLPLQARRLSMY